jgi:hypothetical protein
MASHPKKPGDKRLSFQAAAEIVRGRVGGSVGRSHAELRKALALGEVRHEPAHPSILIDGTLGPLFAYDDGMLDMNLRPGAMNKGGVSPDGKLLVQPDDRPRVEGWPSRISQADLVDWIDRYHPETKPTESIRPETPTEATKPPAPAAAIARKACSAGQYKEYFLGVMKATGARPSRDDDTLWAKSKGFSVKSVLNSRAILRASTKKQADWFKSGPRQRRGN